MRYLLDTHIWLWTLVDPDKIGREVRNILADTESALYLSAASTWEMSIKYRLGKLPLPEVPEAFVLPRLARDGIEPLPIQHIHAVRVASLPYHHTDPFDRLLIATAQTESLTILTSDQQFLAYEIEVLLS